MMPLPESALVLNLVEALGVGLLIGVERQRSAQAAGESNVAGLRTFGLASLAGAVSMLAAGPMMLAVTLAGVILLRCAAYFHASNGPPGLTTSVSLMITVLLGGISMEAPVVAAATGVTVAVLLASRRALHTFTQSTLTDMEVRDGLVLASIGLVVLPVLPNESLGPEGLLNPYRIALIVWLVMAIGAMGHIATRVFGARLGLPLSGFLSGFVSSSATIVTLGRRSASMASAQHAAAGAVLSSVSSFAQIGIVLGALSLPTLRSATPTLLAAGLTATLYGAVFAFLSLRRVEEAIPMELPSKVFSILSAVMFALTVTLTLLAAAILQARFGDAAVLVTAAIAGLVSTQSAAAALAAMVVAGRIGPDDTLLPLVVAISANIFVRIFLARSHGAVRFARIVIPGLVLSGLAAWAGWFISFQGVDMTP